MKIRPIRELLSESMAEMGEIAPTREAIAGWIAQRCPQCPSPEDIRVVPHVFDHRIGWFTHLVKSYSSNLAYAYTDGPLEEPSLLRRLFPDLDEEEDDDVGDVDIPLEVLEAIAVEGDEDG